MITKLLQAFLAGIFFTFILDFFLFLGIFKHYIEHYEIDLFYNILFADHQNIWLYLLVSAALGWLSIYYAKPKPTVAVLGTLFVLVLLTLIPPIGEKVGSMMLLQPDQHVVSGAHIYTGDIYYDGREHIYILDDELNELVKLPKSQIKY